MKRRLVVSGILLLVAMSGLGAETQRVLYPFSSAFPYRHDDGTEWVVDNTIENRAAAAIRVTVPVECFLATSCGSTTVEPLTISGIAGHSSYGTLLYIESRETRSSSVIRERTLGLDIPVPTPELADAMSGTFTLRRVLLAGVTALRIYGFNPMIESSASITFLSEDGRILAERTVSLWRYTGPPAAPAFASFTDLRREVPEIAQETAIDIRINGTQPLWALAMTVDRQARYASITTPTRDERRRAPARR